MKRIVVLFLLMPSFAFANVCDETYVGARLSGRSMEFKTGLGDNLFAQKNSLMQYSVFGGTQFNEYFGTEVIVFTTNKDKRTPTINSSTTALGIANFAGMGPDKYEAKTQLCGTTLQVTARYPIVQRVSVFAAAGAGYAKIKLEANMLENDGVAANYTQKANNSVDLAFSKIYPVAKTGLDVNITDTIGVRADIGWEGTSAFKKSFYTVGSGNNALKVKARDSFVYGMSLYAYI